MRSFGPSGGSPRIRAFDDPGEHVSQTPSSSTRRSLPSWATDAMRPRQTSAIVAAPLRRRTRPGVVAAEQRGREVEHVAIDETCTVERARDRRATLDHRLQHTAPSELVEHLGQRTVELDAGVHLRVGRRLAEDDLSGSGPSASRTVSAGSSARTVPAPTITASLSARRRCASARASGPVIHWLEPSGRRRASVERRRHLEHDPRPAGAAVLQVGVPAVRTASADSRPRRRCRQLAASDALAGHERSGSSSPTTTRLTPDVDEGVGAGRGAAVVRARLEGRVHRCPGDMRTSCAGGVECDDLGVATTRGLGRPFERRSVAGHEHGADPGIGRCDRAHASSQLDRPAHHDLVSLHGPADCKGLVRKSPSKKVERMGHDVEHRRQGLDCSGTGARCVQDERLPSSASDGT